MVERRSTEPMQQQVNQLSLSVDDMKSQLADVSSRVAGLEDHQKAHMIQTAQTQTNTEELLEAFIAAKGAWKVLNFIGKVAKPLIYAATIIAPIVVWWNQLKPLGK